jgi:signal transduction histidine kinase
MLEIIILILSVLINSILGLAVITKNARKDVNRLFFYLTISLSAWSVITYFSLHPVLFDQLIWVRFVLASAAILSFFVLASFAVFPDGIFKQHKLAKPALYYLFFVIFITQTPLVFKSLKISEDGSAQPVVAPGIIFFMILALSYLGGAVFLLLKKYRHVRGQIKDQLRIVIFGVATSFAAILITNLFLVSLFQNTSLISFAPLLTLILTGSMAYAILKHKLFDLRLAAARAVAYLLTFSLVIVVYSGVAFLIGEVFSYNSGPINTPQRAFYVGLAVVTALVFQPLKRFFDRTTNKIFFKDAYEPQLLLDELSNILVANIRLEPLLTETSKLLMNHIKLVNVNFIVRGTENEYRVIGTTFKDHRELPDGLTAAIKSHHSQIIVTDDLPYSNQAFRKSLAEIDCSAVIRLSTQNNHVGYLLAGDKKSGNSLSAIDIRILGIIADELAIAIENALRFDEISQFNVTLQEKVDDATKQLRSANHRLKELDQTKDEFISMASHQLRTPLTTIKGYLSMVLEGDVGPVSKEEKKMIQQAFDSAERMVFLISDLLNISRLQSGKFVIDDKPTDLSKMIEDEVAQLQDTAKSHHLTLTYKKPDSFPLLNIDETKIRQVIMNFMDNAIFYTPADGTIEVALELTDNAINYTVTDTGLGVPKAEQHHLFGKFYRAGNARKMRPDGTGLGLFMAKKVIMAQGGAIIFKSEEGKGSTFGFSFPRSKVELKGKAPQKPKAEAAAIATK